MSSSRGRKFMKKTKNLMHKKVITIQPEQSLLSAYKIMKENNIRHLPVVDTNSRPVGLLSERDLERAKISHKLSEYQFETHLSDELKVSDFMSWPVLTIVGETSIEQATKTMLEQKVSCLVVENVQGQVCGIVTTDDLLSYLLDMIHEKKKNLDIHMFYSF
jgi:acetoin utilization protein AcuB